jgi:hypothetical protein
MSAAYVTGRRTNRAVAEPVIINEQYNYSLPSTGDDAKMAQLAKLGHLPRAHACETPFSPLSVGSMYLREASIPIFISNQCVHIISILRLYS